MARARLAGPSGRHGVPVVKPARSSTVHGSGVRTRSRGRVSRQLAMASGSCRNVLCDLCAGRSGRQSIYLILQALEACRRDEWRIA